MNVVSGKQRACSLRRRSAKTVGLPCESALFRLLLPAYQPATPQRRPPAAAAASTLICGSRMILPSDGLRFLTSCKRRRVQTSRSQPLLLRATSSVPRSCPCQISPSGYCPVWILGFLVFIGGGLYEHLQGGELGYFLVGFFVFLPCVLYPILCPGDADKKLPMLERFVTRHLWRASRCAICDGSIAGTG